jgi:SAM-dependent methyltransferase
MGPARAPWLRLWPFYLLVFLVLVLWLRELDVLIPAESREWIWSRFRGDQLTQGRFTLPLEVVLTSLVFLVAALFVPLGQELARAMQGMESLRFYSFDLFGSLLGIATFSAMSALGVSPVWWFAAVTLLGAIVLSGGLGWRRARLLVVPLVLCTVLVGWYGREEIWSPYYSILTKPLPRGGLGVYVNRLYHQQAINLEHVEISGYELPYRFFRGGDVLIVGAGTGNDVALALQHGAKTVDAVEIDPEIQKLGTQHPLGPYADPRVTPIVNDARTYLQTTDERYDLIVFGTLDSHALLSSNSTVRLDNYVYTVQAVRAARRALKPDGLLAMLYSVPSEDGRRLSWIQERLTGMVYSVFGAGHVLGFSSDSELLNLVVVASNGAPFGADQQEFMEAAPSESTILPTDDWPFLYLKGRTLPSYHLRIIPAVIIVGVIPIFLLLPKGRRIPEWNFLVLGAAFLLIETATITRLSLLFGSTWVVNSVVFFSILVMVLLANLVVQRLRTFPVHLVFGGLVLSLLCNYLVGVENLLYASYARKLAAAFLFAGVPIFFAGIVFSSLFRQESGDGMRYAFGSNLLGAFVGGFLEYLGLIVGFNQLLLLVMGLYVVSYVLTLRRLRGAAGVPT